MLDERALAVLARLERQDADERARGLPPSLRSRQVAPTSGRFLFALVAPQHGCHVLEIGGGRGYSTIWLAAAARLRDGSVVSLELDAAKAEAWRRNLADAGLDSVAELCEGDAFDILPRLDGPFDTVFLDAEKEDYDELLRLARSKLEPGGLVVADNVLSHRETLGPYSEARQADPTLAGVTVPLDRGLELTVVLAA